MDELETSRSFQTMMGTQQSLEITEGSIQAVGGVGDLQLRESLVGKQIGQVGSQAAVSSAQPAMGVMSSTRAQVERAFVQEPCPCLLPLRQALGKQLLGGVRQAEHDVPQFLSGRQLGVTCQVTRNRGHLVEVTLLDGQIGKHLADAWPAIQHHPLELATTSFQRRAGLTIHLDGLGGDFLPIQVLLQAWTTKHQHAVASAPKRGISHHNRLLHASGLGCDRDLVQLASYPSQAFPMTLG